ncbi:MAG: D-alanyl-D-alanine carboxypeptidase/D-alanyl-D-alanine-endopeptidase [Myxococcales bacterium]|nr:D-alanyl-D-alanine carboxypeptidase/D-alanyl-D-alanine-endopeptidase [Myxococcales bacterium]
MDRIFKTTPFRRACNLRVLTNGQTLYRVASFGLMAWLVAASAHAANPAAPAEKTKAVNTLNFPGGPSQVPPDLQRALSEILSDSSLRGARVSFMAQMVDTGQVLASYNPDKLINPASNVKLITAAAALRILKPEYRYRTRYYAWGPIIDGVLKGHLVVKGFGDPTVVTERLKKVASGLANMGIKKITGQVVIDDSFFDGVREASGWETEEAPERAYAAPVGALSLNYNAVSVLLRPDDLGKPALMQVEPPAEYVTLEGKVMTNRWGRRLQVMTRAGPDTTLMQVGGTIRPRSKPLRIFRRVYDPGLYYGSALTGFLQIHGVEMRHDVVRGRLPASARLLYVDRSLTLGEVINTLNKYSNNFMAETLIKTIGADQSGAPGTFDSGLAAVRYFLENEIGYEPGSYKLGNGSGLNHVNLFSSHHMVKLLSHLYKDFEIGSEFVTSLGIAGTQGTIAFRMRHTAAERRLRAKTGTLRGVSALSGYVVDPKERVIAFSIMAQGFSGRTSNMWKIQNAIGEALATDGASWIMAHGDEEGVQTTKSAGRARGSVR